MEIKTNATDEARFNAALDSFGNHLRQVIIRLCPKDLGIDHEDILQEARLKLWRALESEREIENYASYLYRVAANATVDAIRRVKARREEQIAHGTEGAPDRNAVRSHFNTPPGLSPERIAGQNEVIRIVENALDRLAEERRMAVGLYLQGMSSFEIGDLLGWTEPKARNLLYRGLKDLRAKLIDEGIDHEARKGL